MPPILHPQTDTRLDLAQSEWRSISQHPPQPSHLRWWFRASASCLMAFASGWLLQAYLVPVFVKTGTVQTANSNPQDHPPDQSIPVVRAPQTAPPVHFEPPAAVLTPTVSTPPAPIVVTAAPPPSTRPVADFANRPRYRFVAHLGQTNALSPGVELQLTRIHPDLQQIDGSLTANGHKLPLRDQHLLQAIPIDPTAHLDVIFTAADSSTVTGYVILPKP